MDRSHGRSSAASTFAVLLALETRWLLVNRAACVVIVLMAAAAAALRVARGRQAPVPADVCYVVYWQQDDWTTRLAAEAGRFNESEGSNRHVQLVAVQELADDEGTIRYPPGVHSIQLRPLETGGGRPRWLVWFWYAGNDPSALLPYVRWFWQATAEHFGPARFEQRVSPLMPELTVLGRPTQFRAGAVLQSAELEIGLVAAAVFFCACYLPTLSLAEGRAGRTLESLVVTPAGWTGAARARQVFYGLLGGAAATITAAILRPAALGSVWFWWSLLGATVIGLGIAQTAGSLCRSVASAGATLVLYAVVAGVLAAGAISLAPGAIGPGALFFSAEASLFGLLQTAWKGGEGVPIVLPLAAVGWAVFWQSVGRRAYRRLRAG